jgi:hypothetical protein
MAFFKIEKSKDVGKFIHMGWNGLSMALVSLRLVYPILDETTIPIPLALIHSLGNDLRHEY